MTDRNQDSTRQGEGNRHDNHVHPIAGDWFAITGEAVTLENWIRRVHRDDVARVATAWIHAQKTRRMDVEFRLLDRKGQYVWVRDEARKVGAVWVATLQRVERKDEEHACSSAMCYCGVSNVC